MGAHQSAAMVTDTWLTPPHVIQALGVFDLDPCAAPEPRPWPTAQVHLTREDDGLTSPWTGRVWLNPPYSREATRWLARMAAHGRGTALVFARTETSWFIEHVWKRADLLLFMAGRVHFHHADGSRARANAGAPSVLAAYGAQDAAMLAASHIPGALASWRWAP